MTTDRRGAVARYLLTEGGFPLVSRIDSADAGWMRGGRGGLLLAAPFANGLVTGELGLRQVQKDWIRAGEHPRSRVLIISEKYRRDPDEMLMVMTGRAFTELTRSYYDQKGAGA